MTKQLYTVTQFAGRHPAFSVGALRNLIYKAHPRRTPQGTVPGNGLAPAIVRVGRKVLIDEPAFFQWLESRNTKRGDA